MINRSIVGISGMGMALAAALAVMAPDAAHALVSDTRQPEVAKRPELPPDLYGNRQQRRAAMRGQNKRRLK